MKQSKVLLYLLYILIGLDILTMIGPWGASSLFLVGIPGLGLTIWLLILHLRTIKAVNFDTEIKSSYITHQIIAGILLITYITLLTIFLNFTAGISSWSDSISSFIVSASSVLLPSVVVFILTVVLMKRHNSRLKTIGTSTNNSISKKVYTE